MKRLYYATFKQGFSEVIKQVIKKQDKNSKIKSVYNDSILFFADEHFNFKDSCFLSAFVVIFNMHKTGVGAINVAIKSLLEKKDLKISLPKDISTFKLTISKYSDNINVDAKLKNALEVMLKKITKRGISYFSQVELMLLAKNDGEVLFMKSLDIGSSLSKLTSKFDLKPETAYLLNFLSDPQPDEVVVDPFSKNGIISYVRALCFKSANVIASDDDKDNVEKIKKISKSLKNKHFSVLNYSFLSSEFPIRFIDKIVTDLTKLGFYQVDSFNEFFEKAFELKVKTVVVVFPKNYVIEKFIKDKYEVLTMVESDRFNVYKLKIRG